MSTEYNILSIAKQPQIIIQDYFVKNIFGWDSVKYLFELNYIVLRLLCVCCFYPAYDWRQSWPGWLWDLKSDLPQNFISSVDPTQ
jgi:hypothetical protein